MSPVAISPLTQVEGEWLRAVACQRLQIREIWGGVVEAIIYIIYNII